MRSIKYNISYYLKHRTDLQIFNTGWPANMITTKITVPSDYPHTTNIWGVILKI